METVPRITPAEEAERMADNHTQQAYDAGAADSAPALAVLALREELRAWRHATVDELSQIRLALQQSVQHAEAVNPPKRGGSW